MLSGLQGSRPGERLRRGRSENDDCLMMCEIDGKNPLISPLSSFWEMAYEHNQVWGEWQGRLRHRRCHITNQFLVGLKHNLRQFIFYCIRQIVKTVKMFMAWGCGMFQYVISRKHEFKRLFFGENSWYVLYIPDMDLNKNIEFSIKFLLKSGYCIFHCVCVLLWETLPDIDEVIP